MLIQKINLWPIKKKKKKKKNIYIYIYIYIWPLGLLGRVFTNGLVQSQVKSYQRLKKWYLISPCLTLSIVRYISRIKWSNLRKGVVPFPTPQCSNYWKRDPSGHPWLWSPTLLTLYICIYMISSKFQDC